MARRTRWWTGVDKPEARIQHHKTAHLKGTCVRPVPPRLQRVIKASLESQPRLFVSPANGQRSTARQSYQVVQLHNNPDGAFRCHVKAVRAGTKANSGSSDHVCLRRVQCADADTSESEQ